MLPSSTRPSAGSPASKPACRRAEQHWTNPSSRSERPRRFRAARRSQHGDEAAPAVIDVSLEPVSAEHPDPAVAEALAKVASAFVEAESSMEKLHTLPSARLPSVWDAVARTLKPALEVALLLGFCSAMHSFGPAAAAAGGLLLALGIGAWGYRKSALSASGAAAAVLVGWGTLGASFRAGLTLLAFFFSSSKITKIGDEAKASVDEGHRAGGQRDWRQVACNGLLPTLLALGASWLSSGADAVLRPSETPALAALYGAFLGYYACCCGDTWASELGQLSPETPRMITSLRPVRRGANGGVTLAGTAASAAGGLLMGAVFYAAGVVSPTASLNAASEQWALVPLGLLAGLVGSVVDSLLGATLQFTGFNRATGKVTGRPGPEVTPIGGLNWLSNNAVNAVSASTTAALTGLLCLRVFA